ncbi:MAG: hypothetical protein GVY07_11560 [Bacteroidetes bacterium]|nr:hypothetical protein [Bacteroidota bacterium]
MEITSDLSVTSEQIDSLEMHSVINILSVISGQLQLIQIETENQNLIEPAIEMSKKLADSCSSKDKQDLTLESLREFKKVVFSALDKLENRNYPQNKYLPFLNTGKT